MELIIDPGDRLALELQKLRAPGETLVRIDYRREAAQAPFQFDMANGMLHRRGCAAIPSNVSGALYAIWEPDGETDAIGCNFCRPAAVEASAVGTGCVGAGERPKTPIPMTATSPMANTPITARAGGPPCRIFVGSRPPSGGSLRDMPGARVAGAWRSVPHRSIARAMPSIRRRDAGATRPP